MRRRACAMPCVAGAITRLCDVSSDGGSATVNGANGRQEKYLGGLKNLCDVGIIQVGPFRTRWSSTPFVTKRRPVARSRTRLCATSRAAM